MPISEKLKIRWQLSRCEKIVGHVYQAESGIFGPVILKRSPQPVREYETLARMQGACRVYDVDREEGIVLEERIIPGRSLRDEPEPERRLEVFAALWERLHSPAGEGESYLNWLEQACNAPNLPPILKEKGEKARDICAEIFEKHPERLLLHGDLHHDNILLRADGSYAVIDPKGVIGPKILDVPRFLLNEGTDLDHIRRMIRLAEKRLGYPSEDVGKAYFMEVILANLWFAEDGMPVRQRAIDLADWILEEGICKSEKQAKPTS